MLCLFMMAYFTTENDSPSQMASSLRLSEPEVAKTCLTAELKKQAVTANLAAV